MHERYEGYLIGTRSIVPEMTDEEITSKARELESDFTDNGHYGERSAAAYRAALETAKWYREQIRSQINK